MESYLKQLTKRLFEILGTNLIGVYLQGSSAQNDFRTGKSDIDVMIVVNTAIPEEQKDKLASDLEHKKLPVPAAGLDLMIVTKETAQHPVQKPEFEFWYSTGETWDTSVDKRGETSEVLIFLATCAEQAKAIYGQDSKAIFSPVPYKMLAQTLIDIMEWHRTKILDSFHDPLGQYSVLNACRAWMYIEDKILGSKREGGVWVLKREPENELVKNALLIREGKSTRAPQVTEIDALLTRVLEICRAKAGA